MNIIESAVEKIGGYEATGRLCGVTGKAVRKWCKQGRLPRTEWTGETRYAEKIAEASGVPVAELKPSSISSVA